MILKSDEVVKRLKDKGNSKLVISPVDIEKVELSNSTSVDLRLGTRFLTTKHGRITSIEINHDGEDPEFKTMDQQYVPFGEKFVLHPRDFVLGVTLEWIKLPSDLSGYVQGRSSWGRRGLVIATAVGVHSGFSGCLTLELTNLGEVPISIYPGMSICQLFLHKVKTTSVDSDRTSFYGKSRPTLGSIKLDEIAIRLSMGD